MACIQYRKFLTIFSQLNTRYINLQSCNFARGNRFVPATGPAAVGNFTEKVDPVCSADAKLPNIKSSNASEHIVISLDEIEVQKFSRQSAAHEINTANKQPVSQHFGSSSSMPYYNKLGDSDTKFRYA